MLQKYLIVRMQPLRLTGCGARSPEAGSAKGVPRCPEACGAGRDAVPVGFAPSFCSTIRGWFAFVPMLAASQRKDTAAPSLLPCHAPRTSLMTLLTDVGPLYQESKVFQGAPRTDSPFVSPAGEAALRRVPRRRGLWVSVGSDNPPTASPPKPLGLRERWTKDEMQ